MTNPLEFACHTHKAVDFLVSGVREIADKKERFQRRDHLINRFCLCSPEKESSFDAQHCEVFITLTQLRSPTMRLIVRIRKWKHLHRIGDEEKLVARTE